MPDASTCTFIGCGVQARSHAVYLRRVRPGLKRAAVLGRGAASRDAFAAWLQPGALAIGVDLGRSWLPSGYAAFDLVATDDSAESRGLVAQNRLKAPAEFGADLGMMLTGKHPGRRRPEERIWFVFAGHVLGDLAVASAVYQRAAALGIGTRLLR